MTARRSLPAALLLAIVAIAGLRCSSDTVAGGTETGNPEVTACAMYVFNALVDTNSWNVCAYVPGGMAHLDSAAIVSGGAARSPGGSLAKRWTSETDTVVGSLRYVVYTTYINDTLLLRDTSYIPDSVVTDTTVDSVRVTYDTSKVADQGDTTDIVKQNEWSGQMRVLDTVVLMDTLVRTDTVYLHDTLIIRDTFPVGTAEPNDTAPPLPVDSAINFVYRPGSTVMVNRPRAVRLNIVSGSQAEYVIVDSSGNSTAYAVNGNDISFVNRQTTDLISKNLRTASGAVVAETYADLDGDGTLFGGSGQRIRFGYNYVLAPDTVSATVDFDGGADGLITTLADDLIRQLTCVKRHAGVTAQISYCCTSSASAADTLKLSTNETCQDSSLEILIHSYDLIRGNNSAIGNDDRLVAWEGSAIYSSGPIDRMDMRVALDQPVARGAALTKGVVNAVIWMRDHSVGVMDSAEVYFGPGVMYMHVRYSKNGDTKDLTVDRTGVIVR